MVPRQMADLVAAARSGQIEKARGLQVQLNPLHRLLFVELNPIPVKKALELMGRFGPDIRPPLTPMTEPNAQKLRAELQRLKVI